MLNWVLFACAICFGQHDAELTYVLAGMLALPFVMVGVMFGFLYYMGVFRTNSVEVPSQESS